MEFLKGAAKMIKACLGEVHITRPDYQLCKILNITKQDVDLVVEADLYGDITSILDALADVYGADKALDMWTKALEAVVEERSEK